jgi:hypothetical protein
MHTLMMTSHELCDVVLTFAVIAAAVALPLGYILGTIRNGVALNRSEAERTTLQDKLDGYFRMPTKFYRDLQDYQKARPLPYLGLTTPDGAHAATDSN